jgi:hypothetical protein
LQDQRFDALVRSMATTCPAGACGAISNGCNGTVNCGTCTAPQTCGGGGTPNVCGCTCAYPAPTNKDQCRNDGWKTLAPAPFKSEQQCTAYVDRHHDDDHNGDGH